MNGMFIFWWNIVLEQVNSISRSFISSNLGKMCSIIGPVGRYLRKIDHYLRDERVFSEIDIVWTGFSS